MDVLLSALRAAAEPTRLRLLALCAHSDLTVSDLTQILGQSQPRVSRHLKLLSDAGLLERFREGSWAYFRLAQHGPAAEIARTLVDAIPADDTTQRLDLERLDGVRKERAERASDYFEHIAARWDEVRSLYADESEVERILVELLADRGVVDLLDIGTGTGRIIEVLSPHVGRAVGIDLSREMLQVARANLERSQLRNCVVRQGDMYQLPLSSESFDVVTIHQVLHFAEQPAEVVSEAARVLRPGGRIAIVDFATHELEELRDEHSHRWLGFGVTEINEWCGTAGLLPHPPIYLPGDTLTVVIWSADRPDAGAVRAA